MISIEESIIVRALNANGYKTMSTRYFPTELLKSGSIFFRRARYYLMPMTLPILLAMIPTLYHYGNNVEQLTSISLFRMLVFNVVLAMIAYFVLLLFNRFQSIQAAHATVVFLVFFNVYGLVYRYLLHLDIIRIKHYTLLPLMLMLSLYSILWIVGLKNSVLIHIWKNLVLIVGVMALFNLMKIIPAELKKWESDRAAASSVPAAKLSLAENSPDIYYIILDEFAGFEGMREYWHYEGVNDFVDFLKDRGFFVAEASHASSTDTLHQMATRLNYQVYPYNRNDLQAYFDKIADNRVMRFLKSRGYTTVAFDERKLGYPSAKSIHADYLYEYGSASIPQSEVGSYGFYFDEFGELVVDNTMLYVVSQNYKQNNPAVSQHSSMISFTVANIANQEIASPKFVYVHLLLPHSPFVFDEDGDIVDNDHFVNWNYYIDNYKFSIKVAEAMVDNILSEANSKNPPVIILQSDHGARNHSVDKDDRLLLQNYPENLKTLIMYTLYLPGYDYSSLPQDIKPINTFPIVFNYLFNAGIPLIQ